MQLVNVVVLDENAANDDRNCKADEQKSEINQTKSSPRTARQKSNDQSSSIKTQISTVDESSMANELENLKNDFKEGTKRDQANKWCDLLLDKGVAGLEMEFEKFDKVVKKVATQGFDTNMDQNLTKTIICQDTDRVLLKNAANHYIHANYVSTPKFAKHFICTQRPMVKTVQSFFGMLVQEHVSCVVMLSPLAEAPEKICPPYFPQSSSEKPMKFGTFTVKCIMTEKMKEEEEITITTLAISEAGKGQLLVKHYHWKNWPERGFPEPSIAIFKLICAIRNFKKPIVVHCSDGVGRSGAFVALEVILQKLQKGKNCLDVTEVTKEIRKQRAMAISTSSQYIVLHRLLLQLFHEFNVVDMTQRLLEFIDEYDVYARKHKE